MQAPALSGVPKQPSRHRRHVIGYGLLCVAALLAMALLDLPVARWVHGQTFTPAFKTALGLVRWPGHFGFTLVLAVLMVWPFRQHWKTPAVMLGSGMIAGIITAILKWSFGRTRPFKGYDAFDWHPLPSSIFNAFQTKNLSFPSGDATLAFATATVFALAFPKYRIPAYGWAILVAVTRVLQGAHYPSDVTGGAIVGITTAVLLTRAAGPLTTVKSDSRIAADCRPLSDAAR